MAKIIGYVLALIGLAIIAFSSKIVTLPFIASLAKPMIYTVIAGVACIAVGVVLLMAKQPSSSSGKAPQHAKEEVPIYEGEGKKRKIVGYRKD